MKRKEKRVLVGGYVGKSFTAMVHQRQHRHVWWVCWGLYIGDISFPFSVLLHHVRMVSSISSLESGWPAIFFKDRRWHSESRSLLAASRIAVMLCWGESRKSDKRVFQWVICVIFRNGKCLTCIVSSPWRNRSRLTMVCSLWALTLVFLSLVLSRRLFSRGLMRLGSMEGVAGSLKTHHSTRSDTSLMSLDWFWRHCMVTESQHEDTKHTYHYILITYHPRWGLFSFANYHFLYLKLWLQRLNSVESESLNLLTD